MFIIIDTNGVTPSLIQRVTLHTFGTFFISAELEMNDLRKKVGNNSIICNFVQKILGRDQRRRKKNAQIYSSVKTNKTSIRKLQRCRITILFYAKM